MRLQTYLIVDFDSTFVSVEALDELAKIALRGAGDREQVVRQIETITRSAMVGEIGFAESLSGRLALFTPTDEQIRELTAFLMRHVSASVEANKLFFQEHAVQIYIVSGGFKEYIVPVVSDFGISSDHVIANTFTKSADGKIIGCDTANLMSQNNGKARSLEALGLEGKIVTVGDGYSDYQTKAHGPSDVFIAYAENVSRKPVMSEADQVAWNFDDVVQEVDLSDKISV
jgi:D-3-phosphoglycerate dehydrogenase